MKTICAHPYTYYDRVHKDNKECDIVCMDCKAVLKRGWLLKASDYEGNGLSIPEGETRFVPRPND